MSAGDQVCYLRHGGIDRRYVLHRPPSSTAARLPIVLMLDGRGGTPWTAMRSSGWSHKADVEPCLAVYPEPLRLDPAGPHDFLKNPHMWYAGRGGSDAERSPVDDVGFLDAVLDELAARHGGDARRAFMCGFSNGASMTFRFALERPGRLAAIGCVAGHFRPAPGQPETASTPLLCVFGAADPICPAGGGPVVMPWGAREERPPAEMTAAAWAERLELRTPPAISHPAPGVIETVYGPAPDGREVRLVVVDDLGHTWPGGHRILPERLVGPESRKVCGTDLLWSFFRRHGELGDGVAG